MVETGGLENRLALAGYGGSNPSPSATKLDLSPAGLSANQSLTLKFSSDFGLRRSDAKLDGLLAERGMDGMQACGACYFCGADPDSSSASDQ